LSGPHYSQNPGLVYKPSHQAHQGLSGDHQAANLDHLCVIDFHGLRYCVRQLQTLALSISSAVISTAIARQF
jgi:hypothetical protein